MLTLGLFHWDQIKQFVLPTSAPIVDALRQVDDADVPSTSGTSNCGSCFVKLPTWFRCGARMAGHGFNR